MAAPGPHLPPVGRRGADHRHRGPGPRPARRPRPRRAAPGAVRWAFNPGTRNLTPPAETASALEWIAAASLPVTALEETPPPSGSRWAPAPAPLAGKPAAASTQRRKRAVFYNAVSYAVELRLLAANPIDRIQWKTPAVAQTVDRRVGRRPRPGPRACSPPSAPSATAAPTWKPSTPACTTRLPAPVGGRHAPRERLPSPRPPLGPHRPGRLRARAGKDWTDDGTARQARGLKHRAQHETRSIPIPPVLVQILRAHLKRYGTAPDGRIFRTARGGIIQDSAYSADWAAARAAALTPAQHASPLARRPYDLRHAAVSLWLNSGVPATEVARRAGHSVAVLLKIYAHCIDGQADAANKRIADALGGTGDSQDDQEP